MEAARVVRGSGSRRPPKPIKLVLLQRRGAEPPALAQFATSALTEKGSPTECLKGGGASRQPAAAPVKVVLAAPKNKKSKVILAAAKPAVAPAPHPLKPTQTRKAARKVRVSMKSLSKKIHKAKTIRKAATDTTIEQVKKELHKAGLIKSDSKAPDTILRQMYADFLTLKSRAL
jgi:hypothetical protein